MAKCTLFKKSQMPKRGPMKAAAPGDPAPNEYGLLDNEDGSVTVFGVNQAGNQVSLEGIATLQAVSSDVAVLSVDPPNGMTVMYHGVAPGKAVVTLTAKANDGSFEFTIEDPCDVASSPVAGLTVTHGTPTAR